MKLTIEEQKRRIENVKYAERTVKSCTRRERIENYMPGQVTYHLGDYPAKFSCRPTEYDYNLIKKLSEKGVEIIQTHMDSSDYLRLYGGHKFETVDPEGMKEFIKLCHDFGIKVLNYVSSGFFDERDPDFIPEFDRVGQNLNGFDYKLRLCSLESPEWCSYMIDKTEAMLDEYEFDGLYNDAGHDLCDVPTYVKAQNEGREAPPLPYDACTEDALARLYHMVKRRGGIMKHHYLMNLRPNVKEKVYDYLWVGEAVQRPEELKATAAYDPYIVPCPDMNWSEEWDFEKYFALFLPLMQFPLRIDGRPLRGLEVGVPGVEYFENKREFYWNKKVTKADRLKYIKEHPDGPYIYGQWSGVPDNEDYRERWFYYLDLYKKIVQDDTLCHIDIKESSIFADTIPNGVTMSLFTGNEQYLCISNIKEDCELVMNDKWIDVETNEEISVLKLATNRVRFLKRA